MPKALSTKKKISLSGFAINILININELCINKISFTYTYLIFSVNLLNIFEEKPNQSSLWKQKIIKKWNVKQVEIIYNILLIYLLFLTTSNLVLIHRSFRLLELWKKKETKLNTGKIVWRRHSRIRPDHIRPHHHTFFGCLKAKINTIKIVNWFFWTWNDFIF